MNRRLQLINWVRTQHDGERIKDTYTPYFEHVLAVANQVAEITPLTYEIGICHDLLEKTAITKTDLLTQIRAFGYEGMEAQHIVSCVVELTRHFTKAESPLPKQMRKALEDERLLSISADAQTVKYADWHYNADWMMLHDRHHVADYLKRHIELMQAMTDGDIMLRETVIYQLRRLLQSL